MTVKKVAIIAAAGAVLLAGALTLSMTLITRNKIEVTATETSAQNETEQEEIQRLAISLEREIENEAGQIADVGRFLQLADRYSDLQELTAATVNELIEKIVIHSPKKIGGKKHVTIEVYFTYVGKIRIPLAKPELPTEIEEPA